MNNWCMKRNTAIDMYIHSLEDYEVYNILDTLYEYIGGFRNYIWFPMDEFDKRTVHLSHTELMRHEGADFSICDTWFRFDSHGILESADTDYICEQALDAVPELVTYCIHEVVGHTGDTTLDIMINSSRDAKFDSDYNPL